MPIINSEQTWQKNKKWESWMRFEGISCSEAFDMGYEGEIDDFTHEALKQAWKAGKDQRIAKSE